MESELVIGLDNGDESKGKITYNLAKTGNFSHCLRFNGGNNSGRTIYVDGQKIVNHIIPTGIVCGIKSIIGPGCVINERLFFEELDNLSKHIPNARDNIIIAYNAHIVQDKHIEEEIIENKLGTTRKGIGPAYRDKHARTGIRAEDIKSFQPFLVDVFSEIYKEDARVLCEGAQAMGLDIDHGDYPYVTSSHCGLGSVINNGIPMHSIKKVHGVIKAYSTYVGTKDFQDPDDEMLKKMAILGKEYGSTTGRLRKTNYLDIDLIKKHAIMNSVDRIHVNKMDILEELNCWKVIKDGKIIDLKSEENFTIFLSKQISFVTSWKFYYSPK